MTDILYVWKDGASSVGMSSEVQLPQFRVLGHRQRATVVALTTVGYTMRDTRYKWNEGPNSVGVSNEVSLPQFKVLGHRQRAMEISLTTGNYSRLACEIQFVRSMGYYLIQIYIPSGLIVIISWVSFWLNRNATPARVTARRHHSAHHDHTQSSTNAALPKISYVKSIDVYLGTCFVMVFTSLLEYATVGTCRNAPKMRETAIRRNTKDNVGEKVAEQNGRGVGSSYAGRTSGRQAWVSRRRAAGSELLWAPAPRALTGGALQRRATPRRTQRAPRWRSTLEENPGPPLHALHGGKDIGKFLGMTPSDIDKYSQHRISVCFVCFNLMYWIVYLHVSDVVADDLVLLEENK
ncbi:unnamed protein product [Arctia plantaginis]|uniref:Neurotransmitter-gated ion-channel transmembrane domain-containing protein n=1 Tax=Arctia plantaginis TaxID=874455 RepID=A0A8S1BTG6_ARCPL|nr:unnamed protein product [Arctia plantaginis]